VLEDRSRRFHGRVAILVGAAVFAVAALDAVRAVRLPLLIDPDREWAVPRLFLGLLVISVAVGLGAAAAGGSYLLSRFCRTHSPDLTPMPLSRMARALLLAAALFLGTAIRFVRLDRDPSALWIDNLYIVPQTLALEGKPADFHNAIRLDPSNGRGNVGVVYLEALRWTLRRFGTTVFGVRFLSALAGALSVLTAALLARSLLPSGGATLAALILAGLRWSLILSRWGWVSVAVAPLADLAALSLLSARRRGSGWAAAGAGLIGGLGTHVYLSAWIAGLGLVILASWPIRGYSRKTALVTLLFLAGFLAAVAPLFLLREGRHAEYFGRMTPRNVVLEAIGSRKPGILVTVVGDSLAAPWLRPDPVARHDQPGRSRLGWILGVPVALVLVRSLCLPREALSAFLLSQAAAALAANVVGTHTGDPNGFRFAYLTTVAAVAAAGGFLFLVGAVPLRLRTAAAIAAIGLVCINGTVGARDLFRWADARGTFASFWGVDTVIGRAALRWDDYGRVTVENALHPVTVELIRRYRLDPDNRESRAAATGPKRVFRVAPPATTPSSGERLVERIRDGWGSDVGVVLARKI
jgi:hypothetical protein